MIDVWSIVDNDFDYEVWSLFLAWRRRPQISITFIANRQLGILNTYEPQL